MPRPPCPRCGSLNPDRAGYCALCQERLAPPPGAAAPGPRSQGGPGRPIGPRRDFRVEQASNRRRSWILMSGFVLIIAFLGGSIGGAYGAARAGLLVAFALGAGGALFAWFGGAQAFLAASGAREAAPDAEPRLHNVVEELAIASGLPKPRLYVVESDAPNAFASGRSPEHGVIAVTRGLLAKLDRDQLQGVLAHEMSHLRNLDARFATLAGILVAGTALVADAHLRSLRPYGAGSRRAWRGAGRGGILLAAVALVMALAAPFLARLLQMAVSRRRELYADASAVEMTRNPLALASALRTIGSDPASLETANRATQHLWIANPVRAAGPGSSALFSTHPPIESRIRILESMA